MYFISIRGIMIGWFISLRWGKINFFVIILKDVIKLEVINKMFNILENVEFFYRI